MELVSTYLLRGIGRFLYKINIVQEEADESIYWIELLTETNIIEINGINELKKEANELTSIFTAILKTLKSKNLKPKI
ncbi:MAG: four helix bundle protein [Bacteroidetes bacterium]|nr:four helix bundle protein [Bacteroidota bacterium]